MTVGRYWREPNQFCRNCERACAVKEVQQPYGPDGGNWELVICYECGWSKIVRDDLCPQFTGKENWPG